MKTLERFWQWFDGETPENNEALLMFEKNVSAVGEQATREAALMVGDRHGQHWVTEWRDHSGVKGWALSVHPEALRDLSLALCAALERMREQVPAGEPVAVCTSVTDEVMTFGSVYVAGQGPIHVEPGVYHLPTPVATEPGPVTWSWLKLNEAGQMVELVAQNAILAKVGRDERAQMVDALDPRVLVGEDAWKRIVAQDNATYGGSNRRRCVRTDEQIGDGRGCDECLCKPCRWSGGSFPPRWARETPR